MPDHQIQEVLDHIYSHSLSFRTSVDIVQRLATYLKLDTFLDTEFQPVSTAKSANTCRLSIAGSLLLLDMDFEGSQLRRISLSSGNHAAAMEEDSADRKVSRSELDGEHIATLNFKNNGNYSFLRAKQDSILVAEKILEDNLQARTLGQFPKNLEYLSNLDVLLPTDGDLIMYIDNVALYLDAIHNEECSLWSIPDIEAGYTNSVGKIRLNDIGRGILGVLIDFWEDSRLLSRKTATTGQVKKALFKVNPTSKEPIDYLKKASRETWELYESLLATKKYKFTFDGNCHIHNQRSVVEALNRKWRLSFELLEPVFLPTSILDIIDILERSVADSHDLHDLYKSLSNRQSAVLENEDGKAEIHNDEYCEYVLVQLLELGSLHSLSRILPSVRNHYVLTNLLRSVTQAYELLPASGSSSETNKKLMDSLHLADEATEEELQSLGTLQETDVYMDMPMLASDTESSKKDGDTPDLAPKESRQLSLSISAIDYELPMSAITVNFFGRKHGEEVRADFLISNGVLTAVSTDVDMDSKTSSLFLKALQLSEDIPLALEAALSH